MVESLVNALSQLEPGRQFLGRMLFTDVGPLIVHQFSLSSIETTPIEVRRFAEPTYFPGHVVPGTIEARVYFYPDKLQTFIDKFYKGVYKPDTGHLGPASIKTDIGLEVLGPDGTPTLKVTLKNCWISSLNLGEIDWGSNNIIDGSMTIVYEKIDEGVAG